MQERKPIIVDTDMAADDWMAIMYLLQHPHVEVLAITVTGTGEAHCGPGVQNALDMLALAGHPDIPVACGRETPLQGNREFPDSWRTGVDTLYGLTLPTSPSEPSPMGAVELLIDRIQNSPTNIMLLTLGPLTNIAELFQAQPDIIDGIDTIYVMGGAVDVPGNLQASPTPENVTAEWNLYVDPYATRLVFEADVPIVMVGLDATDQVPMTPDFYRRLGEDRTTPEANFVYDIMTQNLELINNGWLFFWDGLVAAVVTDHSLVTLERRPIRVIDEDGIEAGRTLSNANGRPIRVAVAADAAAFERVFLNVLNGREP
ncbi:MAG: nucleoside hydrolase [Burkholderiales bacterium]|nr:nucleoside hydrolase [Anaerolineae bacterium]